MQGNSLLTNVDVLKIAVTVKLKIFLHTATSLKECQTNAVAQTRSCEQNLRFFLHYFPIEINEIFCILGKQH